MEPLKKRPRALLTPFTRGHVEGPAPAAAKTGAGGTNFRPLIFLDTNALHYARLYIDFAEQHGMPPFNGADMTTGDPVLKANFVGRTQDSYVKGRKIVTYLLERCGNESAEVEYSPISSLDVICGRLKGKAMLDAASEGLTQRMWGKMDEEEILDRLTSAAYLEVQRSTADIEGRLQKVGIPARESDPARLRDAWSLCRSILSLVYLDVGDSLVYASALLAEADELLTEDGYFRRTVNHIHDPGSLEEPAKTRYAATAQRIAEELARIITTDVAEIQLPIAHNK